MTFRGGEEEKKEYIKDRVKYWKKQKNPVCHCYVNKTINVK